MSFLFVIIKVFLPCQVQELGLQCAYQEDRGTNLLIKRFMALPFLPSSDIPRMFARLQEKATTLPMQTFASYIKSQWIDSQVMPPSCWSVYKEAIRTNNDIEGWHHGLNRRAEGKTQLPLYLLIHLLHQEARLTSLQIRLISEKKMKRVQRKTYRLLQSKVFKLWEEFESGQRSAKRLLKACSYLVGPAGLSN